MQGCCLVVMLLVGPAVGSGTPGNEIMHLLWNYLLWLYGLQLHVCYAQKYSNLMRAMMSVALVEPFFHMSTTARLSQWKRTFWRDQRQAQVCTAQTIA